MKKKRGGNMSGFDELMKKLEERRKNSTKIFLKDKKLKVQRKYEALTAELEQEADFSYWEKDDSINLIITGKDFLTCDEAHSLNELFGMANYSEINIKNNKIEISLWFRLWEWIKKEA